MWPIMLMAAAASLALIPIAREIFWGPMAYAMMGRIIVGTRLTLLFLPALYVAWFRIKEPAPATDNAHENPLVKEVLSVFTFGNALIVFQSYLYPDMASGFQIALRADAALIKEADGRAHSEKRVKLSRTMRVMMLGATHCAELRQCCEKR
jgi:hypothetical protein